MKGRAVLAFVLVSVLARAQTADDADALFERAGGFFGAGEYAQAVPLLRQAADIDAALGDERLADLGYDRKYLGISLASLGQGQAAVEQLSRCLEIFTGLDVPGEQVEVLNYLGLLEYYAARYKQATSRFESALAIARSRKVDSQVASLLNNLGLVHAAQGRYEKAIESYGRAHEEHERAGDRANAAANLGNIAGVYLAWGRYAEAEDAYRKALEAFRSLGDKASMINTLINIGMTASARGAYDDARLSLEQALQGARDGGLASSEAYALASLGTIWYATGRYDQAETAFGKALELFGSLGLRLNVASTTASLGMVSQAWGRNDKALQIYGTALSLARELGAPDQILSTLRLIGSALQSQGRYSEAVQRYEEALGLAVSANREGDRMLLLNALGAAHLQWKKYDQAQGFYREALDLGESLGKRDEMARVLIHLGGASQVAGRLDEARERYDKALAICREIGMRAEEATALNNLGTLALQQGDTGGAIGYLREAVGIKEKLRLTASGTTRRDFLASWISSYRWLIQAYHLAGDAAATFDAAEMVKARTLAEQMRARLPGSGAAPPLDIRAVQRALPGKAVLASFANVDWEHPVVVCASRLGIRSASLGTIAPVAPDAPPQAEISPRTPPPQARGYLVIQSDEEVRSRFESLIQAYRWLLALPRPSEEQVKLRTNLGRTLYDMLLAPIQEELAGAEELLIIPDGSTGILPFEALIMPDGRWLVESIHITYLPSLDVKSLIDRRGPSPAARPLLALGGARYAGPPPRAPARISPAQLDALRAEASRLLGECKPARDLYAALGLDSWPALPGTLAEVTAIGGGVDGSVVLSGADVSERMVKQLARQGALRTYRVLHFATHGVLVPGVPELSAVVLSEAGAGASNEDGYLTMGEVAVLDLAADFVDLSACETGLGKVYEGEGVVGLTQAFLVAGANGMSVSLWQVADDSTREFMIGMYRMVRERGLSYARAMTEMKREFIRKGRWRAPFFWAPFVYYGR